MSHFSNFMAPVWPGSVCLFLFVCLFIWRRRCVLELSLPGKVWVDGWLLFRWRCLYGGRSGGGGCFAPFESWNGSPSPPK